ncbi:type 3 dihydrofolate reductase [Aestuariibacter sp. A3R04]|nr:type 3 dihydrofolate reductase [Aestuariibacter sp. A3R04]MBU3021147.1 type 3 dihydrofolate reductase [Aestuariibacter sp. A3R04]
MIAAMANNRVIGADNDMPWHLPADLKHFKAVTLGKPVIMGRRTFASIGRLLPGRPNIIITRQQFHGLPDEAYVVASPEEAIEKAASLVNGSDEVMIIGGGKIYSAFLPRADVLYLTHIDLTVEGDTQFPDYQAAGIWECVWTSSHGADEKNPYSYKFEKLQRQ